MQSGPEEEIVESSQPTSEQVSFHSGGTRGGQLRVQDGREASAEPAKPPSNENDAESNAMGDAAARARL